MKIVEFSCPLFLIDAADRLVVAAFIRTGGVSSDEESIEEGMVYWPSIMTNSTSPTKRKTFQKQKPLFFQRIEVEVTSVDWNFCYINSSEIDLTSSDWLEVTLEGVSSTTVVSPFGKCKLLIVIYIIANYSNYYIIIIKVL